MNSRGKDPIAEIAKLLWEASGSEGVHPWDTLPERPRTVLMVVAYKVVNAVNLAHQILDHERPEEDVAPSPEALN